MSKGAFNLDDYIDVAERIHIFREKHPNGSLQSRVIRWPFEGTDPAKAIDFIAVEARAYRTPDDERPGVGLAWEPFPGKTPYTKDSELMVAETSAWGRAIVAVLAADTKRGVASRNEVRNRQPSAAQPAGGTGFSSLPERSAPAGAADHMTPQETKDWDQIEADVEASGGERLQGEGFQTPPEVSGAQAVEAGASGSSGAGEVAPKAGATTLGSPLPTPGPTDDLEALWDEASRLELTRARVVAKLKAAGQPITSWQEVDARQLRSLIDGKGARV